MQTVTIHTPSAASPTGARRRSTLWMPTIVLALVALIWSTLGPTPAFAADESGISSGRVVDSRTGEGIGGVTFFTDDASGSPTNGPTAADGSFSFQSLYQYTTVISDPSGRYFPQRMKIPSGTGQVIKLVRGASLSGKVVYIEGGAGVSGYSVTVRTAAGGGVTMSTTTDGSGRYRLGPLPAGDYIITGRGPYVSVGEAEDLSLSDVAVHKDASISVPITFESGSTAATYTALLLAPDGSTVDTEKGAGTSTVVFNAPAGSYRVLVRPATDASQSTWYPGVIEKDNATSVTVEYGKTYSLDSLTIAQTKILSPLSTPTITGDVVVGGTVTATGTWGPAPVTLVYRWYRNAALITSEVGSTYVVRDVDAGYPLYVRVTVSKPGYRTETVQSAAVTPPPSLAPATPTISGSARVGARLTAVPGSWSPAPVTFSYAWLRNGAPIAGATASTYDVAVADVGARLSVSVTGTKAGYPSVSRSSASTGAVVRVFSLGTAPGISGRPAVGGTLTGSTGSFSPAPTSFSYQWLRAGLPIAGATKGTYTLVAADDGQQISLRVTALRSGYASASQTSAATATVKKAFTTRPTPGIIGTPKVGVTLVASSLAWGPGPVALLFQWKANGVAIAGANGSVFTLTSAQAGKTVTLSITGVRDGYFADSRTSPATRTIVNVFTGSPTPSITGTARPGSTLTANGSGWAPQPVTLRYQWLRNGTPISGATSSMYRLVTADGGKRVTVAVTGQKSGFASVTRTSASVVVAQ